MRKFLTSSQVARSKIGGGASEETGGGRKYRGGKTHGSRVVFSGILLIRASLLVVIDEL